MKEDRRASLNDLLQLEDGRILASSRSGDRYWLVDDATGATDSISVQAAALLWQRCQVDGRERLERARADSASGSLFGEVPASTDSSGSDSSGSTFREMLRQRLGMLEDD